MVIKYKLILLEKCVQWIFSYTAGILLERKLESESNSVFI